MPTTLSTQYYTTVENGRAVKLIRRSQWVNSPKSGHKLLLRSNTHDFLLSLMLKDTRRPFNRSHPWGDSALDPFYFKIDWGLLEMQTYQMFRRKLYQGSASLGVTIGSYKQSRSMIVSRYQQLGWKCDDAIVEAIRTVKRDGAAKALANLHLEIIFGWMPLVKDIHAAATTVIHQAPVREFIRVSKQVIQNPKVYSDGSSGFQQWQRARLMVRSSRGALVTVSNPNVWLAERAGLLNPAAVAWDLVPWSFVVNMFSNIGVLVNSITDYAGLSIDNGYKVRSARGIMEHGFVPGSANTGQRSYAGKHKTVTLDAVARPPLTYRIPQANWETAAMAASLFTQKFSRLVRLVK